MGIWRRRHEQWESGSACPSRPPTPRCWTPSAPYNRSPTLLTTTLRNQGDRPTASVLTYQRTPRGQISGSVDSPDRWCFDGRPAVEDWLRCRTLPRAACCTLVTALSSAFFEVPNSNHVQPLPSACRALTHCSGVKGVRPLLVSLSTASVRPARSSGDTRAAGDD